MKQLKRILLIFLILLVSLGIGIFIFLQTLKPSYEGEIAMAEIQNETKVYFDEYGIPHIYASNEEDAIRVLGYVHAQDRLWQMELLRRIARGRLSEVFGKQLLSTDKFFIALGIDDASIKAVSQLDINSRSTLLAEAYLDGINEFIENGPTPIEYYLTGVDKSPFALRDIYNAIGYMAFSFAQGHKTDPLLTHIRNTIGPEYLVDLEIDVDTSTQWIRNFKKEAENPDLKNLVTEVQHALDKIPIPQFIGSNSWVLAPPKTKNGSVILANDPHIGFAQPAVWYEAHINSPSYEKYGFHLAGIPFPLLGHDRNLAYGLTMFENDDTDFYFEKRHPQDSSKYLTAQGYRTFDVISRTIKVKDSGDIDFKYQKSVHGPVLNGIANQIKDDNPISLSWIYTKQENRLLESLYRLSHGRNIKEFRSALPLLH
ncbi:MAG: penicillin acylase family protein, partial [Flavobacteriaceae bacterium]